MELKKLAPWNWFTKEEEIERAVPVRHQNKGGYYPDWGFDPALPWPRDVDRLFEHFVRGFGGPGLGRMLPSNFAEAGFLKPKVDLSAAEKEYLLTVEIPGVTQEDVKIDISDNTLTIKGEKKQEKEEKDKNYYRLERSYGSFQRVLSLPEDVDQEGITATFSSGVLKITMPRKAGAPKESRQITINTAS